MARAPCGHRKGTLGKMPEPVELTVELTEAQARVIAENETRRRGGVVAIIYVTVGVGAAERKVYHVVPRAHARRVGYPIVALYEDGSERKN